MTSSTIEREKLYLIYISKANTNDLYSNQFLKKCCYSWSGLIIVCGGLFSLYDNNCRFETDFKRH